MGPSLSSCSKAAQTLGAGLSHLVPLYIFFLIFFFLLGNYFLLINCVIFLFLDFAYPKYLVPRVLINAQWELMNEHCHSLALLLRSNENIHTPKERAKSNSRQTWIFKSMESTWIVYTWNKQHTWDNGERKAQNAGPLDRTRQEQVNSSREISWR